MSLVISYINYVINLSRTDTEKFNDVYSILSLFYIIDEVSAC
jgi:hypothetical protein